MVRTEAQKELNKLNQRAYRARKKAEKDAAVRTAHTTSDGDTVTLKPLTDFIEEPALQIEVNTIEQSTKKQTLMERLGLASKKAATPGAAKKPAAGRGKKSENNLLTTVLPTTVAALIATYTQDLLPDEYKKCAPSRQEVQAILGPIMAIIGRRVEIYGKASQDAIDIANALISSLAYSARAYITFIDIKKSKEGATGHAANYRTNYNGIASSETERGPGPGDHQDSNPGADGYSGYGPLDGGRADNDSNGHADNSNGATTDGNSEAAIFAAMLARDKRGRARLGLLPG